MEDDERKEGETLREVVVESEREVVRRTVQ